MVVEQVVRASVPPSSFATLLRRSKFATYDPRIGQIYTTHDGHAHRGDWGLKRPLAVRRRDAHLAIHTVDTLYQQTEWTSAHSDAVWVEKFEKLGVTPTMKSSEAYLERSLPWLTDPDFAQSEIDVNRFQSVDADQAPVPNVHAMGEKRFKRYVKRLRKLAPEFEEFVEEKERKRMGQDAEVRALMPGWSSRRETVQQFSFAQRARDSAHNDDHHRFIASKYMEEYKKPNSTFIRPLPHPAAGLTYATSNNLQNVYMHQPAPGRRLMPIPDRKDDIESQHYRTLVAGWIGVETVKKPQKQSKHATVALVRNHLQMTDFGTREGDPRTKPSEGTGWFRATDCQIVRAPAVVGRYPARIDDAEDGLKMELRLMEWNNEAQDKVMNPHLPGTPEYVSYSKPTISIISRPEVPSMTNQPRPRPRSQSQKKIKTNDEESSNASSTLLKSLHVNLKAQSPGNLVDDSS